MGKVSAAIGRWEAALALDDGNATALSYVEYIKKNRIRIAVHLGRSPLGDDEPIDIPQGWPEPPGGLCDPVPPEDADEEPPDTKTDVDVESAKEESPAHQRPATKSSGLLPYAEVEVTGASQPRLSDVVAKGKREPPPPAAPETAKKAPPAPRPAPQDTPEEEPPHPSDQVRAPSEDDYLAMEIVLEDDEPPADPLTLPPPPESPAAPEMIIEAPKEDADEDEPQDYLYDRASSEQLESLSLDRLAGKGETSGSQPTATPAGTGDDVEGPEPEEASDDAPTRARKHTPSDTDLPAAEPDGPAADEGAPALPQTPLVATTFDEVDTSPRSDPRPFSHPPPAGMGGPSPYTTLAGLGPRVLFAEFGDKDLQGAAPPLNFEPAAGQDPAPPGPTSPKRDDYERESGSFSEDAPTRARDTEAPPTGLRMDGPPDFDREEGSFSDDIPTQARPSTVREGPGVVTEPRDFAREGSFSDDIPTTARPVRGDGEAGIRAMPLDQDFRREGSFSDDLATLERENERKEERLSVEMEALLHPEQGLTLARQLFDSGEHARSLHLAEQLQERYPTLSGISQLIEENHSALEGSLLETLGDLASIPVPKTSDLGLDNTELDPRAAFLFSRIDGTLSLQDIIDISGMSLFESARILLRLRELGLLDFEPPR